MLSPITCVYSLKNRCVPDRLLLCHRELTSKAQIFRIADGGSHPTGGAEREDRRRVGSGGHGPQLEP